MVASTKTLKIMSAVFKTEEANVQGRRNFHILMMCSNYAINISVIIGSMMAASTKTLQFISVTILKVILKQYTRKAGLWTHALDALDACTL